MEGFQFQFVDAIFLIALVLIGYKIYGTSKKMFGNTTAVRILEEEPTASESSEIDSTDPIVEVEPAQKDGK